MSNEAILERLDAIQTSLGCLDIRVSAIEASKSTTEQVESESGANQPGPPTDTSYRQSEIRSTDRSGAAALTNNTVGPTEFENSAADIQRDFERLRDSLARIPTPPGLKVSDSSNGIKQECRPALKVLSKCARFAETGLKVLSQIPADRDSESVTVDKNDLESVFVVLAAQINFLQSEYAALVVRSTFNEDTSRMFRSFENNQGSFNEASLQNVRIAAELAAAQARFSPHSSTRGRGRGRGRGSGANFNYFSSWNRPHRRDGDVSRGFPTQRYGQGHTDDNN